MAHRQKTAEDTQNFTADDGTDVLMDSNDSKSFPPAFIPHEGGLINYDTPEATGRSCFVNAGQEYHIKIKRFKTGSAVTTITGLKQ